MEQPAARDLFASARAFRNAFESGLARLLDTGGLNLFILVAANASFERGLSDRLRGPLERHYGELLARLRAALQQGQRIDEADDDLLVFLKIASIGFDSLALTERRRAGCWEVQFNHLRSFRPLRNSQRAMTSIRAPFDEQAFHFNKPFMQQETIWSGELLGRSIDLYYNKYPFIDSHCLLVPDRQRRLPQYLDPDMHEYTWELVGRLGRTLPDVRVAYNALGAFASVNHLHLQLFLREESLPLEAGAWVHNGGKVPYPLDCRVFDSAASAWRLIEALHRRDQAYNLLYLPGRVYCIPRRRQGDFALAPWSNGFSWYETCGGMITFNQGDYRRLDAPRISADLSLARLDSGSLQPA